MSSESFEVVLRDYTKKNGMSQAHSILSILV